MCWKMLDYPPYSPEMPPCDFPVFSPLWKALNGCKFGSDKDVKAAMVNRFNQEPRGSLWRGLVGWYVNRLLASAAMKTVLSLYSFTQNNHQISFI
jgi:hypothetical protein